MAAATISSPSKSSQTFVYAGRHALLSFSSLVR